MEFIERTKNVDLLNQSALHGPQVGSATRFLELVQAARDSYDATARAQNMMVN